MSGGPYCNACGQPIRPASDGKRWVAAHPDDDVDCSIDPLGLHWPGYPPGSQP